MAEVTGVDRDCNGVLELYRIEAHDISALLEKIMRERFEEPIWFLVGLGYPHRVDSVAAAYQLLLDQPALNRDASFESVIMACKSALVGEIDAATVRRIVERFAKRRGILAPMSQVIVPVDVDGSELPHV